MVFPGVERRWWRIVLDFGEYGSVTGVLGLMYETISATLQKASIVKKILATLPIAAEGVVLDDVELLIRLPERFKQTIYKRDHIVKVGDIVYRPHVPALSIFSDGSELYEPVERIGFIRKEDVEKFLDIMDVIRNLASIYVEVRRYEPKEEKEEEEE